MKTSIGAKPISYPTPVFIVGTYDSQGKPNAMTVAWGGVCCSKPPCLAISVRKATYTYGNLVEKKAFTVNTPSEDHLVAADYFGIVSGRDEDKFAVAGLTAVRSDLVDAPYVDEFPVAIECKIVHMAELGLHTLFVGEIQDVKVDEAVLNEKGKADPGRVRPFSWMPADNNYYATGPVIGHGFIDGKDLRPGEE